MVERNLKFTVMYDGGAYHGFQRQNNALAVQNVLEDKLALVFKHEISLVASGRTDTGVHALGQVVSCFTTCTIPVERIVRAANSYLPDDIVITAAEQVPCDFHARYSALSKTYVYRIQQGETLNPFLRGYTWYLRNLLAVDKMRAALRVIEGTHDFSAFQAAGSVKMNPVRTIYQADCQSIGDILEFTFFGNGFLYHMVRNLMGTVVNVGKGKTSLAEFQAILDSKDRTKAGATAPAQGLYLKKVDY